MSEKRIIAVTGATGAQGGGLARAILNDRNSIYKVRAITRDVNSVKANELKKLGAEIVAGNIDEEASISKAFEGAYAAYCVTFYWAHMSPVREISNAHNLAKAAKHAGIKHAIWSTFEDTRKKFPLSDTRMPTLNERFKVPHFDAKAEADHYFTDLGVPTTFLLTSFYWENLIYFGMGPKKGADGKYSITFPMGNKKLPSMSAEDIGKCAYGIFKLEKELIGKTVGIAGEHITISKMAETLSKVLGIDINYNEVTPDVFRSFGFPGADDMGNMFQYKRDYEEEYCNARNLGFSRSLNPELMTFEKWVVKNKNLIPLQ
jgi:uncharacterized protein YbjT (DUF2867 family)